MIDNRTKLVAYIPSHILFTLDQYLLLNYAKFCSSVHVTTCRNVQTSVLMAKVPLHLAEDFKSKGAGDNPKYNVCFVLVLNC